VSKTTTGTHAKHAGTKVQQQLDEDIWLRQQN
jgi:hypothetical protein